MLNEIQSDGLQDFNIQLYNEYLNSGVEREDPGFEQPISPFPASCSTGSAFEELDKLISDTTDALTYQKWLSSKLEEGCGDARDSYVSLRDNVDDILTSAKVDKDQLVQGFYEALSDHHTFLEDYANALISSYEDAKAAGTLPSMSDI